MPRALSQREREVLDALLAVDFPGVETLRAEAQDAVVVGGCQCGCPSIDFYKEPGKGMCIHVNAGVEGRPHDGLFLFSVGGHLGGIEWVNASGEPDPLELPPAALLKVTTAG